MNINGAPKTDIPDSNGIQSMLKNSALISNSLVDNGVEQIAHIKTVLNKHTKAFAKSC